MNSFPSPPELSPVNSPQDNNKAAKSLKARWMKTFKEDEHCTSKDVTEYTTVHNKPTSEAPTGGGVYLNGTTQRDLLDLSMKSNEAEATMPTLMPQFATSPTSHEPPVQMSAGSSTRGLDLSTSASLELQYKLAQAQAQVGASGHPGVMSPMTLKQQTDLIKHVINLEQQSQMIKQAMLMYLAQAEHAQDASSGSNEIAKNLTDAKVPTAPHQNGLPPNFHSSRGIDLLSAPSPPECLPYPLHCPKPQAAPIANESIIKVPDVTKTLNLQKQPSLIELKGHNLVHENRCSLSQERRPSLAVEKPCNMTVTKHSCDRRSRELDNDTPINSPGQTNCTCSKPTISTASKVSKDMGIQTEDLAGIIAANSPVQNNIDQALKLLQSTQPYDICKNWLAKHVTVASSESNAKVTSSVELPTSSQELGSNPLELLQTSVNKSGASPIKTKPSNGIVDLPTGGKIDQVDSSTEKKENESEPTQGDGDTEIDYTTQRPLDNKCPVCGDVVSGYHYGIYSCESCKGFFKRTVQSKRNERLRCGRGDSCSIDMDSRKHCASCRFNKCLSLGMKLEAIRGDRQRGGRSMYHGSSEFRRRQELQEKQSLKPQKRRRRVSQMKKKLPPPPPPLIKQEPSDDFNGTNVPGCSHQGMGIPQKQNHVTPEMNPMLRALILAEEELINQDGLMECCRDVFDKKEEDIFSAACHLMDHQLYTFVKWARTLPLYQDLKTEDQIVLMQRRGLYLMAVTVCFYFISEENLISLPNRQKVVISNIEDENVKDIVQGLVDTAGRLHQLKLDKYQLVCLKGIMLLNPVSKGLIEVKRVQEMQDQMEDLLIEYVNSQPHLEEKVVGELLLRLSEIERLCQLIREEVITRKSQGRLGRYPLLMELFQDKPSWLY